MTPLQYFIFYTAFFISAAIFGFPRFFTKKLPRLTSEEITILRPGLRGVKYTYNISLILGFLIVLVLFIKAGSSFEKSFFNEYFLFFAALSFLGLFDGLFALATGVFPATTRWNLNQFVYDDQARYRGLAQLQAALAILGMMVCFLCFLLYKG